MANWPFTQGIHDLGAGCFGYVQPDGTWGWSNAGLIVSAGQTMLVDTLMSVPLTQQMLTAFKKQIPAAQRINRVINTHANPDHFFGNQLLKESEIIATARTSEDMAGFNPEILTGLRDHYKERGEAGEFLYETMGRKFDFSGIEVTLPNRTFEQRLSLTVGDKQVECVDLGPAHTQSDVIVYVPEDKVVFTGDLIFNEGHPLMWAGPIENWIAACDYILGLDVEVVVPGHGPISDKASVRNLRCYFEYVRLEARKRFDAGMDYEAAARDMSFTDFKGWSDPERIVANVFALYRAWGAPFPHAGERNLFAAMARYHKAMTAHDAE